MADGTNEHDAGADAASGFLCGVCDTPLPAGADHCISCGTPVVWLDEDAHPADEDPTAGAEPEPEPGGGADATRGARVEPTPVSLGDNAGATAVRVPTPLNAAPGAAAAASAAASSPTPVPAAPSGPINAGPAPVSAGASTGEHTTLLIGVAVIVVALVVAGFIVVSGSKKDDTKTGAATTATTVVAPPTTAASLTPSTKATATTKATPTTQATPTTADAPTTTAANKTAAFCAASKIYTVTDVVTLGNNAVKDPDGQMQGYNDFLANAPDDLKDEVQAMGGLTKKSVAKVKSGEITTPQQLQQYIAAEPPDDVVKWIAAQQKVVPELEQLCA